jgi:hypothetical protein
MGKKKMKQREKRSEKRTDLKLHKTKREKKWSSRVNAEKKRKK